MSSRLAGAALGAVAFLWTAAFPSVAFSQETDTASDSAAAAETPDPNGADEGSEEALDETLVTVWGDRPRRFDVIQGSNVVTGDQLDRDLSRTLGETLSRETGVHQSSFGPGASRPVIRGFDGPRVRVLSNGIGSLDASVSSPDHNVSIDPLSIERIEVLRGAGALRYGPSAIGGVVNVIDGRIPTAIPEGHVDATLRSGYGGNANERFVGGAATVGAGHIAVHGSGFIRDSDDIAINGLSVSRRRREALVADGEEVEASRHDVPNTDVNENRGGSMGASFIWDQGYAGFAYSRLDNNYGIIEQAHEEDGGMMMGPPEPEEGVRIDLEQDRYDVAAEYRGDLGPIEQLNFRGAYVDYRHDELEGGGIASSFKRFGWEGRLEAQQRAIRGITGLWGFQFLVDSFANSGEEFFQPRTQNLETGLFTIQQASAGPFDFELGFRWDRSERDPRGVTPFFVDELGIPSLGKDTFNTFSFSAGAAWVPNETYLVGLSIARTERAPRQEELYSGGPHLATVSFEVGDPGLDEEAGIGVELTARKRLGRVTGGVNLFYTNFDDYIFLAPTGAEEDDLPVFQFTQKDAEIWGAELELGLIAYEKGALRGLFDLSFDFVRGEEQGGRDLPRIAPWTIRVGAEAQSTYLDGRIEVEYVGKQDDTAAFELTTEDYAVFNASVALRPFGDEHDLAFILEGRNLTNSLARNHVSFTKDVLPLPGRDIRVSVRYSF